MEITTTPRVVAEMIAAGAQAVGARVTYSNADDRGRFGTMIVEMPDPAWGVRGATVMIKIEMEN